MKYIITNLLFLVFININAQYYTGQKVFASKFPSEIFDINMDTYLKIINSDQDLIVAIENVSTGKVIRHAYINSEEAYEFKNIPVGSYVCKYMWTDKFSGKKQYNKDDQFLEYEENQYGGYVITMEGSVNGNLSQSEISENDFFN
tara:strand:- start:10809 stop:11243 length:435 start_codon:yes stop_codon:yes gene_type:complete